MNVTIGMPNPWSHDPVIVFWHNVFGDRIIVKKAGLRYLVI